MPPTYNEADSKLINDLRQLAERKSGRRKLVKAATYNAPADENIQVVSWKMDEFKYYDIPSPFPTLARGLFTTELDGKTDDGGSRHRIVARGYDKFFNIGEVPWTTWDAIKKETKGPYTLTLKSNGCIIFISALTPDKLLICSKHSLGAVGNREESHAQVGERWLEKHLKCVGKTKEDLARTLWEKNWTAVAELCDDEFEEHVLPYSPDKSGLHLHGLNESTGLFKTQPTPVVDAFARDWGFIVTASLTLPTADEVQRFSEDVGRTGKWEGEAVEGFVVRTTVVDPPTGLDGDARKSPYAPGSSFFFKIKFAEPYMMYRDWREVTKTLLAVKGPLDAVSLPKSKMSRPETKMYAKWVTKEITRDREPFEHFNEGRGIIAARERFLQWLASQEGKGAVKADADEEKTGADSKEFGKTIIVPVAVPGVGKTAIAVALKHLFGFAHTQSDDIKGKNSAPRFVKNVFELLKTHDVVIADKNNHLRQHREQLRDAVKDMSPPVRLLALSWSLSDRPQATIHRICADRVLARGTNHQSLHGDASARAHESVIWQFLAGAEELGDKEVDAVIDMDVGEDIEDALDRAIDGVTRVLGLSPPSREKIGEALAAVRGYVPASVDAKAIRPVPIRYFGLLPEINFHAVLAPALEAADAPLRAKELWAALKEAGRTTARPHVTLAHMKSMDDPIEKGVWDRCAALHTSPRPPTFRFRLGRALCDGRVLAVTVEELAVNGGEDDDQAGQEFVAMLPANVRERLHVTVGTRDGDVKPVEAKAVVERFNRGEIGDIEEVVLPDAWVTGRVKGLTA